jgi:dihydrofolate reductase/thymidylate synthase
MGYKNQLPWKSLPEDMAFFKKITSTSVHNKLNAVIMGGNTFRSMKEKPLPNRYNFVISRIYNNKYGQHNNVMYCNSLDNALRACNSVSNIDNVYVIAGQTICEDAIKRPDCSKLYLTKVEKECKADVFFPEVPNNYDLVHSKKLYSDVGKCYLNFETYENRYDCNSDEYNYLELLNNVLNDGITINDRTGVGTIASFGHSVKYDIHTLNPEENDQTKIRYSVPFFTTKKLYWQAAVREWIWMINGMTNVEWLHDRNVHVWDGNSSREFLDNLGLNHYPEGELGPVYGAQWVNWNGDRINQIKNIINELKEDPNSRRGVLTAWNPGQLHEMALPPCHWSYEFEIFNNKLNCKVNLRSNDLFLGHPFNVCGASIFTIAMSRAIGVLPGSIMMSIKNAHIYSNHVEQVKEQLTRTPYRFPVLTINKEINNWEDMTKLDLHPSGTKNFKLENYNFWPKLSGEMAV